jgi:C-terminal processing protease CtpA/Prc
MTRRAFVLAAVAAVLLAAPARAQKDEKKGWFGVQIRQETDGNISIVEVINDSPAEKGGLKGGDVILKINGVKPADLKTTVQLICSLKPKQKVKVQVRRQKKEMELTVIVGER